MTHSQALACPYVYADGKSCIGHIIGWKIHGGQRFETAWKVRLWCSEHHDHRETAGDSRDQERMVFRQDDLFKHHPALYRAVFANSQ